jgi:hypothetical protein
MPTNTRAHVLDLSVSPLCDNVWAGHFCPRKWGRFALDDGKNKLRIRRNQSITSTASLHWVADFYGNPMFATTCQLRHIRAARFYVRSAFTYNALLQPRGESTYFQSK